jgi:ankyrin repeat protein
VAEVKELLAQQPRLIDARDSFGGTPLHVAAASGHRGVVEVLVAQRADVNARASNGVTPLHLAASLGHQEVTELLLANGADVNATDSQWQVTALHSAAGFGRKQMVELLLARGADVHARNIHGQTPLDVAVCKNQTVVADLLRERSGPTGSGTLAPRDRRGPSPC